VASGEEEPMETNQDEHGTPDEIEETANSGAYDAGAETDTAVSVEGKVSALLSPTPPSA
jgi:hypothetical protein